MFKSFWHSMLLAKVMDNESIILYGNTVITRNTRMYLDQPGLIDRLHQTTTAPDNLIYYFLKS